MPAKIKFSVKKNAHFGGFVGFFLPFCGSKSRFLHFFKVFFELFKECFGIFLDVKGQFLVVFSVQKVIHDPEN